MTQAIGYKPQGFVLTIFAQVTLSVLALFCILNLFQVDNLLLYADRFFKSVTHNESEVWWTWSPFFSSLFHVIAVADLTLTPLAFIFAIVRLHAPTWNGAVIAQIAAIANAFLILFLWIFNGFVIAVGSMYDVHQPRSAIEQSVALVLANILAASMLSGIMRNHKNAAALAA